MIVLLAILADLIFGNPENFPSIIDLINLIVENERSFCEKHSQNQNWLRLAGLVLALVNILAGFFLTRLFLGALDFNLPLKLVVTIHLGYMTLSSRYLDREAKKMKQAMKRSPAKARQMLGYMVSRDTSNLSNAGMIRACIENIAKECSDLVIGPLFYMAFGVEFAIIYRIIVASREAWASNEDLAFFIDKVEGLASFIPARLTSLLMVLGSFPKFDSRRGFQLAIRDHGKHYKTNSGWPIATVAGLLGIRLGGGAFYEGIFIERPFIGDDLRPVRAKDIDDSIKIMYRAMFSFALVYLIIFLLIRFVR